MRCVKSGVVLVLAGLALSGPGQVLAANKCTGKDGAVIYQDAPCPGAAAIGQPLKLWGTQPPPLPEDKPVAWTGAPLTDLLRATALLDAMATQGRGCEWALKVTRADSIGDRCKPFLLMLRERGQFVQVNERLQQLTQDHEFAAAQLPALRRCARLMEDVVRLKEVMMAHLALN